MDQIPDTRHSLLFRLRDPADAEAWSEFLDIYRPMIYRLARLRGWQDADAQDVSQSVLVKIASKIESFDPAGKAKFRTWLSRVCQNTITDEFRRRRTEIANAGNERLAGIASRQSKIYEREFSSEQRRAVFRWAAKHVVGEFEPTTWDAFRLTAVEGKSPASVARQLGVSVGAIYTARSRVMRRLRQKVQEYDEV